MHAGKREKELDAEAESKLTDRKSVKRLPSQFLTQFLDNGVIQFLGVLNVRTSSYTTHRDLIRSRRPLMMIDIWKREDE